MVHRVDHTALKFSQAMIIALLSIAFLGDSLWLVALVAAVMIIGTLWPRAGIFKLLCTRLLEPVGLLKPNVVEDDPQPHLFAQGLGGIILTLSVLALALGVSVLGWLLAAAVIVLAAINLLLGFCFGCFLYYQLARMGVRPALSSWQPAKLKKQE